MADCLVTVHKLAQMAQVSEEETIQAAIHGLHPTIKPFMGATTPTTNDELLTKSHDIEVVQSTETQAALLEANLRKRNCNITLPSSPF